ncbi:hypothetical protein J463_2305 [Acinetobacter baumannii 1043794]|nr:hypothetical protein P673_2369 [Acinetobacter baumannii UH6507]EXA59139.1 hypothetical protein J505_0140 [Acinetobacter baumannii 1297549]EXC69776.1 hypothetical protein J463_2305 [Acinetobacter baumannii 1043794]EXD90244.1 hypothetical protein J462_2406 [Acinetobacter baumannii 972082]EXE95380.1 hypothetical protein J593_1466 [Acinetobacter baumannii 232184]EXF08193.1 hypothetical protein J600_2333 [Acinetobacter baumannii 268680]EXH03725.1 hypothetical protein J649_0820 [Acinetobacter ba
MFGSFKPYTYKKREIDDDYFSFFILGKNYFFIALSTA